MPTLAAAAFRPIPTRRWRPALAALLVPCITAAAQGFVWVDRTERPALETQAWPEGGPGLGPALTRLRGTMHWDGVAWQRVADLPAGVALVQGMVHDRARGEVVALFAATVGAPATTWTLAGSAWTQRGPGPSPLFAARLHFDPALDAVLAFIEPNSPTSPTRDFVWTGSSWTALTPGLRPSGVHDVAADHARRRLVGLGAPATPAAGQTWEWDGASWAQVATAAAPAPRDDPGLGFDPRNGRVVLFGGRSSLNTRLADTWDFDGLAWRNRTPATVPVPQGSPFVATDRRRGQLVLFDGIGSTAYHAWTGSDWTPFAAGPPTADAIQYANDPLRDVLVRQQDGVTFEWDGRSWRRAGLGIGRRIAPMAFDVASASCVVFGGLTSTTTGLPPNDTWTWDGVAWTQHTAAIAPSPRIGNALLTHVPSVGVILFGGSDMNGPLADTWLFRNGVWAELTATLPLAPPGGNCLGASGGLGSAPIVVAGDQLWQWNTSWTLLDAMLPTPSPRAVGMTAANEPILTGSDATTHLFVNGGWQRQGDLVANVDAMALDPLRGTVLGFDRGETFAFTDVPSEDVAIGSPCGSPGPELRFAGMPRPGDPAGALDAFVVANAPVLFAMDLAGATIALGGGCTQHLAAPVGVGFTIANGGTGLATLPLPLPANPALRGLVAFAQVATLQPGGPFGGLALSNGLRIRVGD